MVNENITIQYKYTDGDKNIKIKTLNFKDCNISQLEFGLNFLSDVLTIPNSTEEEALPISAGVKKTISFEFKLFNTEEDMSDGTNSYEVKTINEKRKYLFKDFPSYDIFKVYEIKIIDNFGEIKMYGIISSLNISNVAENPTFLQGRLELNISGSESDYNLSGNENE